MEKEPFQIPGVFLDEIKYFKLMMDTFKFKISPAKLPTVQMSICDWKNGTENCEGVSNSYTAIIDTGAFQNFIWQGIVDELKLEHYKIDQLGRKWYRCALRITDTWFTGVEFMVDSRLNSEHQVLIGCQFLSQWRCVFEYNAVVGEWSLVINSI